MIIYDKTGLMNQNIQQQAEQAHDAGLITLTELTDIQRKYITGFYTPNLIIRVGFFVLTVIGCFFIGVVISLIFSGTHVIEQPVWPFLLGLGTYAALEYFVKEKHLFHSGIDDALLWITAALLTGSFVWAMSGNDNQHLFISGFTLLLSLYFTLRFLDTVMSIAACLSFLALIFFAWSKAGTIGEATMPFVMMLFSFFIFSNAKNSEKDSRNTHYRNCLFYVQLISLLTLYAAGNYFVVQKLGNQLHHLPQENNSPLPFSWFFWIWTMLLPVVYVGFGIKNKSMLLLRTGLLLIVAAGFTIRNYYHLLPPELALIIFGTLLIVIVISAIRYLKTPKNGFIYAQRNSKHWTNNVHLESLIVAGATHVPSAPVSTDRFGGGSFGGGGSSSDF